MKDKHKGAAVAAVAVAAALGGTAMAAAGGGADDHRTDTPITGSALDRAKAAALDATGGGRVTETEVGDEEGAYEVEVTRADGSRVDVHLDTDFTVTGQEDDGAGEDEQGADD